MTLKNLITINEFAKSINKSVNTVRTWKRRNNLPANIFVTIAGAVFVYVDKFNEWVEKQVA